MICKIWEGVLEWKSNFISRFVMNDFIFPCWGWSMLVKGDPVIHLSMISHTVKLEANPTTNRNVCKKIMQLTILCAELGEKIHLASTTQDFTMTKPGNIGSIVFERSEFVGAVLIDMGKYFYTVRHEIIISVWYYKATNLHLSSQF